jgi:hypothetical protein
MEPIGIEDEVLLSFSQLAPWVGNTTESIMREICVSYSTNKLPSTA